MLNKYEFKILNDSVNGKRFIVNKHYTSSRVFSTLYYTITSSLDYKQEYKFKTDFTSGDFFKRNTTIEYKKINKGGI